jgi:hypothetical protein
MNLSIPPICARISSQDLRKKLWAKQLGMHVKLQGACAILVSDAQRHWIAYGLDCLSMVLGQRLHVFQRQSN